MTWSLTADACSVCLKPGAAHRQSERRPASGIEMATANWTIDSEEDGCPQCHEARRIIHSCQREKLTASQTAPLRLTTLSYPASGGTRPPAALAKLAASPRMDERCGHIVQNWTI
jgi:hypothetical protein